LTPANQPEKEKQPPRVSVVVVSRNRRELLKRCLTSIENSEGRETLQVILVDNGSRDGSAQLDSEFPAVQFIRLPKNFGLTKSLNLGWRAADAEYVLFLHDDTELERDTVVRLAEALDANPDAAAVCPLLADGEGRPAPQLGSLPPDGQWRPAQATSGEPAAVEYPRGAALMMRVLLIKSIRQIDERYGQFGGDADLATQIRRGGKKILLLPALRVRHQGGEGLSAVGRADFQLGRAVYLAKYQGFAAGLQARLGAVFSALFGFRFGELKYLISGQKIDGTQE
jgi:N-acetylglucosaminyl-diphospho-decaprenol L-rhamnosyltransferase